MANQAPAAPVDEKKAPAKIIAMSLYASERTALFRLQAAWKLKTPFDVFRKLAIDSGVARKGEFRDPRVKD